MTCQALLAVGVLTFVSALALGQAQRAWQAYLMNFLFWTGVAQCGVIFSCAYRITKGGWSDAFRRMGESLAFFLPVSLALFLVMMLFGARSVFPWTARSYPGREGWLTTWAVTARDGFVFLLVFGLSIAYVYYSQRRDEQRAGRLAPIVVAVFALGFSLVGFDLVMSLDPESYNTMFGLYFFVGSFYSCLAVLVVAAAVFRKAWNLEAHIQADQSHDIGRLLFGICLLSGGLFWAQWLVFWYGNLPEEIVYVIRRYYQMPFAPFAWTFTYGAFVVPMVILLSRKLKRDPRRLVWVGVWILAMIWLERYVWIVPSIWKGDSAPLAIEVLVTLGFLGGFAWGWIAHNRRYPVAAMAELPVVRQH
jgi:hypothetical protein